MGNNVCQTKPIDDEQTIVSKVSLKDHKRDRSIGDTISGFGERSRIQLDLKHQSQTNTPNTAVPYIGFHKLVPIDKQLVIKDSKFPQYPAMQLENGDIYEGCWYDEQKFGNGTLVRKDGSIFQGEWEADQLVDGRIIYPNGDVRTRGKYIHANGVIRIGDEHQGRELFPDGSVFEGNYVNGMKHGQGVFNYVDGSYYKGEFYENQFSGYGFFKFKNGDTYEGQWLLNRMHGQGVFKWKDGKVYKGGYRHGYKHGDGQMKFSNGDEFIGQYENGYKNGKGKWIHNNVAHEKIWKNGYVMMDLY